MSRLLTVCLLLALAWACAGCGTRVYEGGKPVFAGYGNYDKLKFRSPAGSVLEIEGADHSTPTGEALLGGAKLGAVLGGSAIGL